MTAGRGPDVGFPADLTGHGPIPASLARRIAADPTGTWRRLVTRPMKKYDNEPPPFWYDHVSVDRAGMLLGEHRLTCLE